MGHRSSLRLPNKVRILGVPDGHSGGLNSGECRPMHISAPDCVRTRYFLLGYRAACGGNDTKTGNAYETVNVPPRPQSPRAVPP